MLEEKPGAERTEYFGPFGEVPNEPHRRSDVDIRRDIETALFYDRTVRSYQVTVEVKDGLVTLSGTVDSEAERRKAEEDVRNIFGVQSVCNDLKVQASA